MITDSKCFESLIEETCSAGCLRLETKATGYRSGDGGHGGFISLTFENLASFMMEASIDSGPSTQCEKVQIIAKGDSEAEELITLLTNAVKFLQRKYCFKDFKND